MSMVPTSRKIEKTVKKLIADQLGMDASEVKDEMSYVEDMGADSLDIVELIMSLEEEFELEVPDEDAEKMLTVKDTVDYVRNKLQQT